jgi:hypothetical protein
MAVTLPLESMTTSDKLAAMELLWDDLTRDAERFPSPEWHGDVLEAREASLQDGSAGFADLDVVKERLRKTRR